MSASLQGQQAEGRKDSAQTGYLETVYHGCSTSHKGSSGERRKMDKEIRHDGTKLGFRRNSVETSPVVWNWLQWSKV